MYVEMPAVIGFGVCVKASGNLVFALHVTSVIYSLVAKP